MLPLRLSTGPNRRPHTSAVLIAQCSASASRSTRVTVVAPAFAALRPATPSPEPSSQTRSPRTSSGVRAMSAARLAAAGQTLAHDVSASMLPRVFSHCQSTSASGGLTTARSGKKPPGTCTSGGSDAEPAWISIVLSGSDAVIASWAAPASAAAEHMSRGYATHAREPVSGRRLLVNAPTRTMASSRHRIVVVVVVVASSSSPRERRRTCRNK